MNGQDGVKCGCTSKLEHLLMRERGRVMCGGPQCRCDACVACESYRAILDALEFLLPEAIDAAMKDRSEQ